MTAERRRQALQIFESAIDLDPQTQALYLDEQCGNDDILRQEVDGLLRARQDVDRFLDSPVLGSEFRIGDVVATGSTAEEDIVPGSQIGNYVVEELIATGGMGAVFRVRDSELGRDLAVKVLRCDLVEKPHLSQRFLEEAQIAGQLEHPGIVPIHEIGTTEDGRPYIAMKLIRGETFSSLLRERNNLTDDRQRMIRIFDQICRPVAYVHASDVIHRDLKPSNILVGSFGEVQVTDWGLAKVLPQTETTHRSLPEDSRQRPAQPRAAVETVRSGSSSDESLAGSVIGTPAYMPPEQARGEIQHVDRRSDVFALGAILCEILTGEPPYANENRAEQLAQAASGVHQQADERLEQCGADRQLIDLARRCLSKAPDDRPSDASQVSDLVREYFTSIEQRARSLEIHVAKSRLRTILIGTVLLAIIVVSGGLLWNQQARQQRRSSVSSRVQESLGEARVLEAIARNSPRGDDSLWNAALQAILAVKAMLSADVDGRLQSETNDLALSIESQFHDARFLAHLARIRNDEIITFSTYDVGDEYREAFSEYLGTEFASLPFDEIVARFRGSAITDELATALYEWALTRHINSEQWQEFAAASDELSPASWRRELVEVIAGGDVDQVGQFASRHLTRDFPNSLRSLLANILEAAGLQNQVKAYAFEQQGKNESAREQRLLRKKHLDAAVLIMRQTVSLEPDNYRYNFRLGEILVQLGHSHEATRYLGAACSLKPSRRRTWLVLMGSLIAENDAQGAVRAFLQRLSLKGDGAATYTYLVQLLEKPVIELPTELTSELVDACEQIYANDNGREAVLSQILGLTWRRIPGRISQDRSLKLVQDYTQRTHRKEPYSLVLLAEIRHARGEYAEAVRNLEEARELVSHDEWWVGILDSYRESLRPQLASYVSIDAASEQQGAPPLLADLRTLPLTNMCKAQIAYLEGRVAEKKGATKDAIQRYRLAMSLDMSQIEPAIRLASILDRTGDAIEAEDVLRQQIQNMDFVPERLWRRWIVTVLARLGWSPAKILANFPAVRTGESVRIDTPLFVPNADLERDLVQLLTTLQRGEPIRINCGGLAYKDLANNTWVRDCFFSAEGSTFNNGLGLYNRPITGTDLDPLYQTERWRIGSVRYNIPLPPGEYEVTLHFAEIYDPIRRQDTQRVFDIRVEQEMVLPGLNIQNRAGFATSLVIRHVARINDGNMEISLHPHSDNPKISAIEIKQL